MKIIYENCRVKNIIIWKKIVSVKKIQACTGIFFRLFFFRNCKSCIYNCNDLLSYNNSYFAANDLPGGGELPYKRDGDARCMTYGV